MDAEQWVRLFKYDHLSDELQNISRPFRVLAAELVEDLPDGALLHEALRKLWEAKNAAVMARVVAND